MDFVVDITAAQLDFQPGLRELEAFFKHLPEDVDEGGFHAACIPPKPILETSTGSMTIDDLLSAAVSIDEMAEKPPAGWRLYKEMTTNRRYRYSVVPYRPIGNIDLRSGRLNEWLILGSRIARGGRMTMMTKQTCVRDILCGRVF
jgi:hypothetical protein